MSGIPSTHNLPLAEVDPEIAAVLNAELDRQRLVLQSYRDNPAVAPEPRLTARSMLPLPSP